MFFKKKEEPKNIEDVLKHLELLDQRIDKISQDLENLKKESKLHIQKVGIIRYNPFSNVGGDQSFSVALLSQENDGIVVTSLYAEGGSRVYGKSIEKGKSQYSLSKEEEKSIKKAMN